MYMYGRGGLWKACVDVCSDRTLTPQTCVRPGRKPHDSSLGAVRHTKAPRTTDTNGLLSGTSTTGDRTGMRFFVM